MFHLLALLKPAPQIPEIEDEALVKKSYQHWRIRVFYSMFIGYCLFYFTRRSFAFAMPALMTDLGFDKADLGILASVLSISYGISKFASGIIGDRSNPRYFMALGLMMTGICNICFGLSSTLLLFALFWGLNGWFQGCGWPSCARLLTHWYSQSERGRWWSFWNASHNIGSALIPVVTAFLAYTFGWRAALFFPGVISILGGFFLMNRLCDTPQSLGLPPIEKFRNDYPTKKHTDQERELSVREILFDYVLTNPFIWVLAVTYFFVYFIRTAFSDWSILYLMENKGYSHVGASGTVFWVEIGGLFGGIAAGWASDTIFKGRRAPICVLYCLLITFVITLFGMGLVNNQFMDSLMLFAIGFLIFGPQMLIGMAAAELSHKKAAATASGFVGCVSYIGAAAAGYPLGKFTQSYGWEGFFLALTICAILSTMLLIPLWNARSVEDRASRKKQVATT